MDAALGAQPSVGAPAVDLDRRRLQARLLALELVDDLARKAVSLGPAQVHAQQHLGPVVRFGAAAAGADRQERAALVVFAREEELGTLALVGRRQLIGLAPDLVDRVGVIGVLAELEQLEDVVGALLEIAPEIDLGAQAIGLTKDALCGPLVVPEPRGEGQSIEFGETGFLRGEVKAAPRSTGSALPGRGWRTRPPSSGLGGLGAGSGGAR
jgi:hypothetical protein